jgi:hypothetical protein
MHYNRVIKNPIIEVYWAGWRSDTLALQDAGWQLAVEDDPMRGLLRIALHHPSFSLYGIMENFVRYEIVQGRHFGSLPPLSIGGIYHNIKIQRIRTMDHLDRFVPMDAMPQVCEDEIKNISDMKLFRPLNAIQEIVVESQNVDELLGKILAMQSPRQAELRKARLEQRRNQNVYDIGKYREVYNPKTDIIAQVISI